MTNNQLSAVREKYEFHLFKIRGVVAVGIGDNCLVVHYSKSQGGNHPISLPETLDNVRVEVVVVE